MHFSHLHVLCQELSNLSDTEWMKRDSNFMALSASFFFYLLFCPLSVFKKTGAASLRKNLMGKIEGFVKGVFYNDYGYDSKLVLIACHITKTYFFCAEKEHRCNMYTAGKRPQLKANLGFFV